MAERVGAVIPAAGQARRFGSGENKIWSLMGGHSVLERTLMAFETHPEIEWIIVVTAEYERERVEKAASQFSKVIAVVVGAETRALSVKNGLAALPPETTLVLVHDAARPLLSQALISRVIEGVKTHGAALPGTPVADTVKRINSDGRVRETVARNVTHSTSANGETLSGLTAVQTPQGARLPLLKLAYAAFDFSRHEPTDEASLLEAADIPVFVVPGDPDNLKITRPEDLERAERALGVGRWALSNPASADLPHAKAQRREEGEMLAEGKVMPNAQPPTPFPELRTGFGYDVHTFAPVEAGRKLFLGGIEMEYDRGLEGHSDADVILHAVCDALLGAATLGDIGILFPNTDPAYKGINSLKLLAIVGQRLTETGWKIVNVDTTAVAEAPKIMPHREKMQRAMAAELGIEPERVSVKATTSEGMGFVGRKEGICAWAVATIVRG